MEAKKIFFLIILFLLVVSQVLVFVSAQEEEGDIKVFGQELQKLLSLVNSLLALFLFVLVFVSYKRNGRSRLLFVSMGFLFFSIKSFLMSSELFFSEVEFFDPLAVVLEFMAILSFFYGVLKK